LQLFKGTVVQFAGTQGDRILVEPWDNASPSAYIVGVLSEPLAGGADGHAQTYGELRALNTSAYALNAVLYANASGTFTTTPNSLPIASVTRVHANTGRIFIRLYVPGDHYRDRFRAEARAAATASSITPATVETYYTAQANGDGHYQSKGSDTPKTEGNVVRRTIYWKAGAFAAINASGFTEVVLDDDSTYADLLAAIDDILNANGAPITIWSKRQEVTPSAALLDGYTDDLVGAFATVLLVPDYSGPCMRIRRSGDNAETDIGFDGGDLDRDTIENFCSPGDGFVKTWYNQDGSGNDVTQTATGDQPKIYDAATGVLVNSSAIPNAFFDQTHVLNSSFSASTSAMSLFAITTWNGGRKALFILGRTNIFELRQWNSQDYYLFYGDGATEQQLIGGTMLQGYQLISTFKSSGNISTFVNSSADKTATGAFDSAGVIKLGGPAQVSGTAYISAMIFYSADKSADRAAIESAINGYFNIY
jgi:hypothetical protein